MPVPLALYKMQLAQSSWGGHEIRLCDLPPDEVQLVRKSFFGCEMRLAEPRDREIQLAESHSISGRAVAAVTVIASVSMHVMLESACMTGSVCSAPCSARCSATAISDT